MKTKYLDVLDLGRLIQARGLHRFLPGMAQYIRQDYLRWQQFEKIARVSSHSPDGVIELMPISDGVLYGCKYVNGHPKNTMVGLPTVMAFGVLADVNTGYPLLLSELTLTTALRTAATSALAAQAMARDDAHVMALIGNGAQSEFQALAFHYMLGVDEIRAYDIDGRATRKLMANLAKVPGLHIVPASSVAQAVKGADIVTTLTADKRKAAILTPEMIEPGMHLNAVGGDCPGKTELHPGILRDARIMVEFEPQSRIEGEIQQLAPDAPVLAFWQVLSGTQQGRTSAQDITVFDSVGFALEDFSALRYVRDLAQEHQIGSWIKLVPDLLDPKDLYRLVADEGDEPADCISGSRPVFQAPATMDYRIGSP